MPGLRALEKYAVRCGGGRQPPHVAVGRRAGEGQPRGRSGRCRPAFEPSAQRIPTSPIEIEVDTVEQAREVVDAGADLVLLDNMSPRRS